MGVYKINVYEENPNTYIDNKVIARVQYNCYLDYWNGLGWNSGLIGKHKGITRLKNGDYVLIEGSDYVGEKNFGYIIDENIALNEILKSNNMDLLKMKKFKELNELYLKEIDDLEITDDGLEF